MAYFRLDPDMIEDVLLDDLSRLTDIEAWTGCYLDGAERMGILRECAEQIVDTKWPQTNVDSEVRQGKER